MIKKGDTLPEVTFHVRVRDPELEGKSPNPYKWEENTTLDYFSGKRVILFSLPGVFTPTCSTYQLPGFERKYEMFEKTGIDGIYCMSVNDSFVMNAWAKAQNLENVEVIPDGSGTFTEAVGALVKKDNLGFGLRSWRYALVVDDGVVEAVFSEPGMKDDHEEDPYEISTPENLLEYCLSNPKRNVA